VGPATFLTNTPEQLPFLTFSEMAVATSFLLAARLILKPKKFPAPFPGMKVHQDQIQSSGQPICPIGRQQAEATALPKLIAPAIVSVLETIQPVPAGKIPFNVRKTTKPMSQAATRHVSQISLEILVTTPAAVNENEKKT
jgi:hypothetical protein